MTDIFWDAAYNSSKMALTSLILKKVWLHNHWFNPPPHSEIGKKLPCRSFVSQFEEHSNNLNAIFQGTN